MDKLNSRDKDDSCFRSSGASEMFIANAFRPDRRAPAERKVFREWVEGTEEVSLCWSESSEIQLHPKVETAILQ